MHVDADLGQVRVTRFVGAFAGGKILNAKTARSQFIGGIVWGIGMALHEETLRDRRSGRVVTRDLADYHVPVHLDVPAIEIICVDEVDAIVNEVGAKGHRRDRHHRRRRGDRERGLSRDRRARARPADHAGQAAGLRAGPVPVPVAVIVLVARPRPSIARQP